MKKLLLATILVICFTGVADAEGNWVLWLGFDDAKEITWQIEAAFPSFNQCSERLLEICKAGKGVLNSDSSCVIKQTAILDNWAQPELRQKTLFTIFITRLCLPDTIDPRK